jgi:hypothetical protein
MSPEEFAQYEALMQEHGLTFVMSQLHCRAYEKQGVRVETCDSGETFVVSHVINGDQTTIQTVTSLNALAEYLHAHNL